RDGGRGSGDARVLPPRPELSVLQHLVRLRRALLLFLSRRTRLLHGRPLDRPFPRSAADGRLPGAALLRPEFEGDGRNAARGRPGVRGLLSEAAAVRGRDPRRRGQPAVSLRTLSGPRLDGATADLPAGAVRRAGVRVPSRRLRRPVRLLALLHAGLG